MRAHGKLAPDHQSRELGGGLARRVRHAGDAAVAHHGGLVTQRAQLLELVTDVQHAAALAREALQRLEQAAHRLGREHRCRLIHDEQFRLLQQTAHDLDTLALAHRHRVHQTPRIERQPVALGHGVDARGERLQVEGSLDGERDVLRYRQGLEKGEVLKHHADAQAPRFGRVGDGNRPAVPEHLSGVGPHDTVNDLHQGALAGAVLAQHRMDLAGHDAKADAIVGHHGRVALGDLPELEAGGGEPAAGVSRHLPVSGLNERSLSTMDSMPGLFSRSSSGLMPFSSWGKTSHLSVSWM